MANSTHRGPQTSNDEKIGVIKDLQERLVRSEARGKIAELHIAKQNLALARRTEEIKELQTIIGRASNLKPQGRNDDDFVRKKFGDLSSAIAGLVKKHFPTVKTSTGWTEYDSIRSREDKSFFLQAEVADSVARLYFHPEGWKVFGLRDEADMILGDVENRAQSCEETRAGVTDWRVETMRLISLSGTTQSTGCRVLEEDLLRKYDLLTSNRRREQHKDDPERARCKTAVGIFCKRASEVALDVRACKAERVWSQLSLPVEFAESDADWIDDYDVAADQAPNMTPRRCLFGPVYKIVDGKPVVLRKGLVLRG